VIFARGEVSTCALGIAEAIPNFAVTLATSAFELKLSLALGFNGS
jgi:hypothetical protein